MKNEELSNVKIGQELFDPITNEKQKQAMQSNFKSDFVYLISYDRRRKVNTLIQGGMICFVFDGARKRKRVFPILSMFFSSMNAARSVMGHLS